MRDAVCAYIQWTYVIYLSTGECQPPMFHLLFPREPPRHAVSQEKRSADGWRSETSKKAGSKGQKDGLKGKERTRCRRDPEWEKRSQKKIGVVSVSS